MKRINRKELIEELECLRMGFRTAHDFIAKTKSEKISMGAAHSFANSLVVKYGSEKVDDIKLKSVTKSKCDDIFKIVIPRSCRL